MHEWFGGTADLWGNSSSALRKARMMTLILAYFDPSAGSLVLQALVGGFGGVMVMGRYFWMQFINRHRPLPVEIERSSACASNKA